MIAMTELPTSFGRFALVLALALLAASSVREASAGGASPWVSTEQSQVRLVSATSAIDEGGRLSLGIQVRLEPGWKIYWRTPGEAGFPPLFDWSGSENLEEPRVTWPAPRRFSLFGFETFGYTDEVVLPVSARVKDRTRAATVRLALNYAICKDVCVPLDAGLALDLPSGASTETPFGPLIARYAARVPEASGSGGLEIETATARDHADAPVMEIRVSARGAFLAPDVLVEGPAELYFAKPGLRLTRDRRQAVFTVPVRGVARAAALSGRRVTIILIDGEQAVERKLTISVAD